MAIKNPMDDKATTDMYISVADPSKHTFIRNFKVKGSDFLIVVAFLFLFLFVFKIFYPKIAPLKFNLKWAEGHRG